MKGYKIYIYIIFLGRETMTFVRLIKLLLLIFFVFLLNIILICNIIIAKVIYTGNPICRQDKI